MLAETRPSPEETFLQLLPVISRIVAQVTRSQSSAHEGEDFKSYVHLKLIENDYRRLREFREHSSIETYLTTVIQRLLQDYRNAQWGKWRLSAAAKRGGETARLLESYWIRDGLPFEEVCELLANKHGVTSTRRELEAIAASLPVRYRRRSEGIEVLVTMPSPDTADRRVRAAERVAMRERAKRVLAAQCAQLPPTDALLVALRFQDGEKVPLIAAILRTEPKPLYERLHKLRRQLRRALEADGVDAKMIQDLLDEE